jgi:polyphosphate glucokinase
MIGTMGTVTLTLAIDCGGTGIKGSVLDSDGAMVAERVRVLTPYPLPPERFLAVLTDLAARLPAAGRATVGMPGMIRHGRVVATPHYITVAGPHTAIDPANAEAWRGFDAKAAIAAALALPTIVMNDAEVAAAGAVTGSGFEVFFTLGTGLGCAIFDEGRLLPHLEVSRSPVRRDRIYDTYIGDASRKRLGDRAWSARVARALNGLRPMFEWDRLYLGGGNSKKLRPADVERIEGSVQLVPNAAGIVGGVKAWSLTIDGSGATAAAAHER